MSADAATPGAPASRVERLRALLAAALEPDELEVIDDSAAHYGHAGAASGGGHFRVRVVTHRFAGKSVVARHRMVYDAVADLMKSEVHALSIEALVPAAAPPASAASSPAATKPERA